MRTMMAGSGRRVIVGGMRDFKKLIAWQKASALEDRLEPFIQRLMERRPNLADQLDRSVGSIASHIAEGAGRETIADFRKFLTGSASSASEVENHLIKARRLRLITEEEFASLVADVIEVRKVTYGLRSSLG